MDVEIKRRGDDALHRTFGVAVAAGDHLDHSTALILHHRHPIGRDVLIPGGGHLVARRQIHPELEAPHEAVFLLWHFRMHDAAAGGHPLHAARAEQAGVAHVVAVAHAAGQHIGHGLEAAMRMVGKAGEIIRGGVGAELVQHQKGIEIGQAGPADDAGETHPRPVAGRLAADDADDRAVFGSLGRRRRGQLGCDGHDRPPEIRNGRNFETAYRARARRATRPHRPAFCLVSRDPASSLNRRPAAPDLIYRRRI
jgi:hypothetical protein